MRLLAAAVAIAALLAGARAGDDPPVGAKPPLELVKTIPLPGVEGRIDHMSLDAKRERLFVAALGNDSLEVVSLAKGEREKSVAGLAEIQGVAYAADVDRVAVACGGDGIVRTYDGDSIDERAKCALGDDADNARWDPMTRSLFVGFGGGSLAKIDVKKNLVAAKADVGAHPEAFECEAAGRRVFVNVASKAEVVVVDRFDMTVKARWNLDGPRSNFPMALDEKAKRLYVGCRAPPRLVTLSTDDGKVLGNVECGEDADDVFVDAARKRIYVTCGGGFVDIFDATDADHLKPSARLATASGARTGFFDAASNRLFVAVPHRGAQGAEIRVYEPR